jgi:two-component system, OmpR family, heavy metal sensor histidine kinase CusS
MSSFRLKLAVVMALVPSVIVLAFGLVAWLTLHGQMITALDLKMTLPGNALSRQVLPDTDTTKFQEWSQTFLEGTPVDSRLISWILVMGNENKEILSGSEEGVVDVNVLSKYLPKDGDFVKVPRMEPPSRRDGLRGGGRDSRRGGPKGGARPRDFEESPPPRRGRGGPPPPKPRRGPGGERRPQEQADYRPPVFFSTEGVGDQWRVGAFSNPHATVFVGVDLKSFQAEVDQVRNHFILAVAAGIVLSALAGWMIASKAIRPIDRIAETAERVTALGLDRRIGLTGREDKEFARLIKGLNAMMERLEDSFQHSARFSADASHELKTPLAVMRGELERGLKDCEPGSEQEQRFIDLSEEVHRLNQITEALLTLSRADSGSLELNKASFSLSEALDSFCEDAEILCMDKELTFNSGIESDLVISADRVLVLSVLHNLVSNAIKYNQDNGDVTIMALRFEDRIVVEVSNTGPGIPADQRDRIFKRFYRVDDARSRQKDGFGLGLNIAIELTSVNGGELRLLEDSPSGKTRFAVRFPAV